MTNGKMRLQVPVLLVSAMLLVSGFWIPARAGGKAGGDAAVSKEADSSPKVLYRVQKSTVVRRKADLERKMVIQRIRMIRIWRLTSELNLNESTARKLFPLLNEFDDQKTRLVAEGNRIRRRLSEAMEVEHPEESRIKALINEYKQNQAKRLRLYQEECRKLEEVLTPIQFAKYLLFWERFNHELQNIFREALNQSIRSSSRAGKIRGITVPKAKRIVEEPSPDAGAP